ncbi:hypothetical protein PHJA_002904300 [Phtheirospermum japonicum]|uniref:Uncharacterized protein n=1 Tax=Phtheirospermum japonicum TaxID=374723 RepID=A0A830DPJ3_9LAMI|nr:hypothetical protein PHJA_002904300 [Phtheirospermum japonicum]
MLHESTAFSVFLSHSFPPRRATRFVVLSHKISTPPARWPGDREVLFRSTIHSNKCKKHSRIIPYGESCPDLLNTKSKRRGAFDSLGRYLSGNHNLWRVLFVFFATDYCIELL